MLIWSDAFKLNIDKIDEQHQKLFVLLNDLSKSFMHGTVDDKVVADALRRLTNYAGEHFIEEEILMLHNHVDGQHVTVHHKEHKSFIVEVEHMLNHPLDDGRADTIEKLIRFVASWLVLHILGTDKAMAKQIKLIQQGSTPIQAYEAQKDGVVYDETSMKMILNAMLTLWLDAKERCRKLENKLASMTQTNHPGT